MDHCGLHFNFLLLVIASLIGTGCGVWGGFVVLSASPDKALGTGLEEEEMSGFYSEPTSCAAWAHVDTGDMPPMGAPALLAHGPAELLPERTGPLSG